MVHHRVAARLVVLAAGGEGWKLSKRTSDLLLKTGTSLAGTGTPKEAPPADAPSPQAPAPTP